MDQKQIEEFKATLLARRAELAERLSELRSEKIKPESRDGSDNMTTYSDHPADVGSDLYERERTVGSVSALSVQIREFDEAIYRLEKGNYGICERCGDMIPIERLLSRPSASYCMVCQKEIEKAGQNKR